jgi:hypothetical protein
MDAAVFALIIPMSDLEGRAVVASTCACSGAASGPFGWPIRSGLGLNRSQLVVLPCRLEFHCKRFKGTGDVRLLGRWTVTDPTGALRARRSGALLGQRSLPWSARVEVHQNDFGSVLAFQLSRLRT